MPREPAVKKFQVEIDGVDAGAFAAVENLKAKVDVVEYRDGTDTALRKMPGRTSYENVTLRKGEVNSPALWQWWSEISGGKFKPRTVTITVQAERGKPALQWQLLGCWPCEWEFAAQESNPKNPDIVMVEAITFVVEKIKFTTRTNRTGGRPDAN